MASLVLINSSLAFEEKMIASREMHSNGLSLSKQHLRLGLEDAIRIGLRNNHSIRGAYLERIADKFDILVERDRFKPRLVLSARQIAIRNSNDTAQRTDVIPQTELLTPYGTRFSLSWSNQLTIANEAGQIRNDGATLSIVQPLLRGAGRNVATAPLRRAELSEKINLLHIRNTISNTITQIIIAYREVLRAQESVQIAQGAILRSKALLQANKIMIESGRMAAFDIVQTEADVASQELAYEESKSQLETNKIALLNLLDLDLNTLFQADGNLVAKPVVIDHAVAMHIALQSQPSYLAEILATQQAEIDLLVAKNSRLWDVSLVGGASQYRDSYTSDNAPPSSRTWEGYAGVQVDIPINDLSARRAVIRSQVNLDKQELLAQEARQVLEKDVANGIRDLETRWRQYEIAQRAVYLSKKKLAIEKEKLQAGRSSNFQVLAYESDLRNAENAKLGALISYLNNQAMLDMTLGTTLESWGVELVE